MTPWFGEASGSEASVRARRLAEVFASNGHEVEVLATAARDSRDLWDRNEFSLDPVRQGGYTVRRFPVDRRDAGAFDRADAYLRLQSPRSARTVFPAAVEAGFAQNVRSQALLDHLEQHRQSFDTFLFLPYRWQPVLEGIALVGDRAYLQPCLEREAYAFLPAVAAAFHSVRGLFFTTDAEYRLALHVYGPGIRDKSVVIGEWTGEPARARNLEWPQHFNPSNERYIVYAGPRDETKNVGLLVESFRTFRSFNPTSTLKFVLAGAGDDSYADQEIGVIDLGPIGKDLEGALIEGALALAEPSYDHRAPSVLEAFARRCPVIVNANGPWPAVFAEERSGLDAGAAGWEASSKWDWSRAFEFVDWGEAPERELRGQAARRYYEQNGSARAAVERYLAAFAWETGEPAGALMYHMLASDDLTDDTVRRGLALSDFSRASGIAATHGVGPQSDGTALVVHSPRVDHLTDAVEGKAPVFTLVYDTAAFAASIPEAFAVARAARTGIGTSHVAMTFLRDAGVPVTQEIPFISGTRCWDVPSDPDLSRLLDDGRANCVYAGPFDSNSGIERLLAAFAFLLALEVDARLILCGPLDEDDENERDLRESIVENGLADRILFVSTADRPRCATALRSASIFWTLSAAATSLSPLVDAMWFDVPILAFASAPSIALLGQAGLLVREGVDPGQIAGLAKILIGEADLRNKILTVQSVRREQLTFDLATGAVFARDLFSFDALEASRP